MDNVSLNSITTEIAASLKRELDEPFKRMLAAKVDAWRSRLIRNSLQTKPNESKFFRQTIYVPLQSGSSLPDCIDISICPAAISVKTIPVPSRFGPSLFDFVGSVDGKVAFSEGSPGVTEYLKSGRYSSNTIYYEYILGRIQIPDHSNLPAVRVDGVFDAPWAVMEFNCENSGIDCDYWNLAYPVTGDIKQMIVQGILQIDFAQPAAVPEVEEIEVNEK